MANTRDINRATFRNLSVFWNCISYEAGKTVIQVVERIMSLLDALASHEEASILKGLAVETSLHSSTTHRILNDLVARQWVESEIVAPTA